MSDDLADRRARRAARFEVTKDKGKPVLPDLPKHDDPGEQAWWITSVLHLDAEHPVIEAAYQGLSDGSGHVELRRLDADCLRFEPASRIGTAQKMADTLVWQLLPTDGEPYAWTNAQATRIARVIRLLCGATKRRTTAQETGLIVRTFIDAATEVEGRSYGSSGERYEAARNLRPELDNYGRPIKHRCLVDLETGEYVVRVGDLARVARQVIGGTVAHGWLDARMEALGWARVDLDGHEMSGRVGRRGPHARATVYRGALSEVEDDDEAVTR